jgi:hypothetical protein
MRMISMAVAFAACLLASSVAFGQAGTRILFQNILDTPINLILRNRLDGSESTIPILRSGQGEFVIPAGSSLFDVRVMPDDNINTGFRFEGRNLLNVANNSKGAAVPVGGIIEPRCHCYRTCHRVFHRWECVTRDERVAAFIDEFNPDGSTTRITAPVQGYPSGPRY